MFNDFSNTDHRKYYFIFTHNIIFREGLVYIYTCNVIGANYASVYFIIIIYSEMTIEYDICIDNIRNSVEGYLDEVGNLKRNIFLCITNS
jgi:hypothetical protein